MVLTAVRGALAFLTRLPVGGGEPAWDAFRRTPVALPLAGYAVGLLVALPFLVPLPVSTTAAVYVATVYLVTGVTHADGLADLGDAAAVHGRDVDAERRRAVLHDASTGVGGTLLVALAVVGLALGAFGVAGTAPGRLPGGDVGLAPSVARALTAVALVVAAEVGAKTGMAVLVATLPAAHDGLGGALADEVGPASLLPVAVAVLPLLAFAPALGQVAVAAALLAPVAVARLVGRWARDRLGGVSGDVLGAANELGRVAGLHAGVIAWTLS